jgi:hypothetical protein
MEYWVSSAPHETWGGAEFGGDLMMIQDSQDIFLFHVSGDVTEITGVNDVEKGYDSLDYPSNT